MDGAHISSYPHFSWLAYPLGVAPPRILDVHQCRHVTHRLWLATGGHADVRWIVNRIETAFHTGVGGVGFFPCDRERHTMAIASADGFHAYVLCIPDDHLRRLSSSDGLEMPGNFQARPAFHDTLMRACLVRLTAGDGTALAEDIGAEIAARQIILRLGELVGGARPDWLNDTSAFHPAVMRRIVEEIDAGLGGQLSLEGLGANCGLSPSHFARKFQHSSGLSVNRFANRRRIRMSLTRLRDESITLARLALDLGFCSQSHFTRLFSGVTGMTPKQFRIRCRRTTS